MGSACYRKAKMAIISSVSGYANDWISLEWLYHFNKYTAKLTVSVKRLLLLDEYKFHHIMNFLQYCEDHNIISYEFSIIYNSYLTIFKYSSVSSPISTII